jgi:crotonobetainyl-CoA:carnitine CoA-transferase CaiB-like acyl-CoA transferase
MGNSHPSLYPYEPIPCADGELIITSGNDVQFRKLCEVIGAPELAADPRFTSMAVRNAHRDELRPLLVERLKTRTKQEWFREIIAAGVPCGPINDVAQGVGFATEIGLEPVVEVGEGDAMVPSIRHPITFSETPVDYRYPPPSLDEHGEDIRSWLRTRGPADDGEGSGRGGLVTGASAPSSTTGDGEAPSSTTDSPSVEEVDLRPSREHHEDGASDG